jgi:signal transduction histidine kinase
MNFESVNIRETVQEVLQLISVQLRLKESVYLIDSTTPRVPATFIMDGQRFKQVLINLLRNATKFTFEGFIQLRLRMVKLAILQESRIVGHQDAVQFEVYDTGIGMSAEN